MKASDGRPYCCKDFATYATVEPNPLYPLFEPFKGAWAIGGCCGGACHVVRGMKFCPFCGAALIERIGGKDAP